MKNWLTTTKAPSVPAKAPAKAIASRAEFERKMAEFRRATGKLESCRIGFVCAKTAEPFDVEFGRASAAETFTVTAIEKRASSVSMSAMMAANVPAVRNFDIEAFSFAGWRCPCCGNSDFVRCSCGQINCRWRPMREVGGRRLYKCEPGCGTEGPLSTMHAIDAAEAAKGGAKPKALSATVRPSLPASQVPRLLPRTK
ncbi:hypothetical protein CN207_07495 [Sinorhizobium meliloti]|nr:hypothetical protein CN207_07495 [Sinorhizobium meliloti]